MRLPLLYVLSRTGRKRADGGEYSDFGVPRRSCGRGRDALVCTMDGEANWVSDLLQQQDSALRRGGETASDHASLQLAGVPSVLLMQNGRGYLYHSAADTGRNSSIPMPLPRTGRARGGCGKGNPFCRYAVLPGTGAGTGTELYLSSDTAKCDLLWKFPLRY